MDKGHSLPKGHHEEGAGGEPKQANHSGINADKEAADEKNDAQVKKDIAAVKASEEIVKDTQGNEKPHDDSHNTHKKNLDDTVYNFVK